jgi:hypothetical protein
VPNRRACLLLIPVLSCAPQWADRAGLSGDGGAGVTETPGRAAGQGPGGGGPWADAGAPADALPDRAPADFAEDRPAPADGAPPDRAPAGEPPMALDARARSDSPGTPAVRNAVLVVRDALAPTAGDGQLLLIAAAAGLRVQLLGDSTALEATGVDLVVLAASCLAANLGDRFRDLAVPIISMEPAVFDDLGMTGPVSGLDWEETPGTHVAIISPTHPIAAGLLGSVAVVSEPATLTWGRPAATAQLVATFEGMDGRAAIFGYPARAPMVTGRAPAKRIGFFAADLAAARLTEEGTALVGAAIRWALR